jgi:hypothetical protein
MRRLALAVSLAALLSACADEPNARLCSVNGSVTPDSVGEIGCERDYETLGYEDDPFSTFAHTISLNVVIDRSDGDRLYFLDTQEWWLHFDFVYFVLQGNPPTGPNDPAYVAAHQQFNLDTYHGSGRRYIAGKVVVFLDSGHLVFEMAAGDDAGVDIIELAFGKVKERLFDGDRLKYRPVANGQEQLVPELHIPVITTQELFAGQVYQPLNATEGFGTLRFRKVSQLQGDPILPVDIVVLDRVPNDISVCSGIVTSEFQTPLSHINILAKQRMTPNMAVRDAFDDPTLRALEGHLVKLTVTSTDYAIAEASPADAQAWWDARRPTTPLVPQHDLSRTGLVDLATANVADVVRIGAKAANFAELLSIVPEVRMPRPAFAIPFSYFDAHMTAHGLWTELEAIVADAPAGTELEERLFALRLRLYRAAMDPAAVVELQAALQASFGTDEVRFRSSTNVEDLPSFSGAGLYTSVGGTAAELEAKVKVVWASVFNYAAFVERDFYRVDHRQVMMGVLVHRSFEEEQANGVALTINEYTALRPGFYINSQKGEVSVTNPTGEATPEQILWYRYYQGLPEYYEVLTRSSLTAGAPVLSDAQYSELAQLLELVHARFRILYCQRPEGGYDPNCATDVEWKVAADGLLYIKQARPLRGAQPREP